VPITLTDAPALTRARARVIAIARAAGAEVTAAPIAVTRDGRTVARVDLRAPAAATDALLATLARLDGAGTPSSAAPDPAGPERRIRVVLSAGG
jgi:hypothetical protein